MTTAAKTKDERTTSAVAPWGVEIDVNSNSDVIIQSIPGCRLRGAIRPGRTVKDSKTGEELVPDSWAIYGKIPAVPGMELHVNPARLSYTIIDPLYEDEDLCDRLQRRMSAEMMITSDTEIRGLPPQKGELDRDRMKTLCREMLWLVRDKMARVVKGAPPSFDDVAKLPGEYLLNPGSQVPNSQPRYEKDYETWVQRLSSAGA